MSSTLYCLLLSVTLVSGHLLTDDRTTRRPRKGDPEEIPRKSQTRIQSRRQRSVSFQDDHECQEGNPLGASYSGKMNVTASGRICQIWAASKPHDHDDTEVGEHNHCRNPDEDPTGVWCHTTDPDRSWEYCSVPICPILLKVLDFTADNDKERDSNGEYTGATLKAGFLPESFTICSAIMVDAWTTDFSGADMSRLLDDDGDTWGIIQLYAASSFTEYIVSLGPVEII